MGTPAPDWPPPRRALFHLEMGGDGVFSVSWSVIVVALGVVASALGLWSKVAMKDDLAGHVAGNHVVILEDRREPVDLKTLAAEDHKRLGALEAIEENQRKLSHDLDAIRNMLFEERAEELAREAARRVKPAAREGVWTKVHDEALDNLRNGRPLRKGLEKYLE